MEAKDNNKVRAVITGTTGMVGEGVLHECLESAEVETVLAVNRRPCGIHHPKLKEVILQDFSEAHTIKNLLAGYNACFFCSGVSSLKVKEAEYFTITYTLTLEFARVLSSINPDMVFCYISGAGTDSTEKGKLMWSRVKGKTENDLMKLPFKQVYAFRPGLLYPTPGLKNTLSLYKYFSWSYPIIKRVLPDLASTLKELGQAMINSVILGYPKRVLEVKDIITLAYS